MNELFGLSMTAIMLILVAAFAVCCVSVAAIYVSGRIMFHMGVRNIRRRRAQSALVVSGLMLATIIITAAFATGDTVDYGVTNVTYENLQRTDISLHHFQAAGAARDPSGESYASEAIVARLAQAFRDDPDIEGFVPFLFEPVAAFNPRTKQAEPAVILAGVDGAAMARAGGLRTTGGALADVEALGERELFANERAAERLGIRAGDTVTLVVRDQETPFTVKAIVREERATGALEFGGTSPLPGMAARLAAVQALTGRAGKVNNVSVVLRGGTRGSVDRIAPAAHRLEAFAASDAGQAQLGDAAANFQVEAIKLDAIDGAKLASSVFTTLFLLLGLFSIASGVLLIFMIFVMLAAERRQEMGITRAVGAERKHLVQAFVAEGLVYDILAGGVGVSLGVAFALIVLVGGTRLAGGDQADFLQPHVTARSLVVSFCLGGVLTFITVVGSATYVSRLNIVAAIRGQVESGRRERPRGRSWRWIAGSVPFFAVPPVGVYLLLRRGFGLPAVWTWAPVLGATGILGLVLGRASGSSFLFSAGISLTPLAVAIVLRHRGAAPRPTWTAVGAFLLLYWLMPFQVSETLFGKFDNNGMEMFVLSGIMIVTAFTLVIVYNARLVTAIYAGGSRGRAGYAVGSGLWLGALLLGFVGWLLGDTGGGLGDFGYLGAIILVVAGAFALVAQRFAGLGPALKMGIAYPLANRLRTGMTIAMFALIVFSLVVMSVVNTSFLRLYSSGDATGSWDIVVDTTRNNPIQDLRAALAAEGSVAPDTIAAAGRLTAYDDDRQEVRQAGHTDWEKYVVRGGDDAFWAAMDARLESRGTSYGSDKEVFAAVRANPKLAVIDGAALASGGDFAMAPGFVAEGVEVTDGRFQPFEIEVRSKATGKSERVTVVGALSLRIPQGLFGGLLIHSQMNEQIFGPTDYPNIYVRLQPGTDSERTARAIEAALVTRGVQATAIKTAIDDAMAFSLAFFRLMQAFMGLGLIVGIAAVGVIALRSVVERRQQIGMLRAIGYERHTVALTFLFETAFVSLMGIAAGVVGAVVLSRNLITSADFVGTAGVTMHVPWPEVIVFAVIAFTFALLMTWWPSQRAASAPIAEALRYE